MKAERLQAKPYADLIAKSKKIWEKIRQKKISKPERKKLIRDLQTEAKGHIKDLVFKHDASRVVQTVMKYGDINARTMIAQELKGTYVELSQSMLLSPDFSWKNQSADSLLHQAAMVST